MLISVDRVLELSDEVLLVGCYHVHSLAHLNQVAMVITLESLGARQLLLDVLWQVTCKMLGHHLVTAGVKHARVMLNNHGRVSLVVLLTLARVMSIAC